MPEAPEYDYEFLRAAVGTQFMDMARSVVGSGAPAEDVARMFREMADAMDPTQVTVPRGDLAELLSGYARLSANVRVEDDDRDPLALADAAYDSLSEAMAVEA